MSETLYPYYERELVAIRQLAQEFAKQYPAAAGRLLLEPNRSVDPHVERLIESFALLAGRVHHKLDDEFPELTESLLSVLYPHYLAPIPSMAIVQFDLDAATGPLPDGFLIDRGSRLLTPPVQDLRCRYRTGYPVMLWPIQVANARLTPPPFPPGYRPPPKTAAAVIIRLECQAGQKLTELSLDSLRFYLAGDYYSASNLYELIFCHSTQVVFRPLDAGSRQAPIVMHPSECISQVGFEQHEGLLPYSNRSFLGYRLLTEFFSFPHKFLFFDLHGFDRLRRVGFEHGLEVTIFLSRSHAPLENNVDTHTFRLGCTPIVNLFEQIAEPIALTQARYEYRIVPDVAYPFGIEVYSVDSVTSTDPTTGTTTEYQPFYSFRHGMSPETDQAFWYASRRVSTYEGDRGTDSYLNLVDLNFTPHLPAESTLVVRTTCTNRNLPAQLQRAGEQLHLELTAAAPLERIRCLRTPTLPLRPPLRRAAHWRLLSHLHLNHLSISDPVEGLHSLQEIMRLYDFADPASEQQLAAVTRNLIEGITGVSSRRVVARTGTPAASGFCRGLEVTVDFDEQKYMDTGAFLFACVLERFLGMYASINSFTQLVARMKQGERHIKRWPPRAGDRQLL